MNRKSISQSDIKKLWGKSGSKCALCKKDLVEEGKQGTLYIIGEMAHIRGENPGSARFDQEMKDEERNLYDNLILLCPNCHTTIDNNQEYTAEKLMQIKREHEKWVEDSLREHLPHVTFAELEVILKYLTATPVLQEEDYITIIPPKEKMRRNSLSSDVEKWVTLGMLQVRQVEKYLNENPDIQFAERLRAGFVSKYEELRNGGLEGDTLFYELWNFSSGHSPDFGTRAAGLSVLTYFFDKCEVFEK
jgi:hypothetical protein